uniref:C2H2-type domain-containing protein n=1 Tax=Panagrolaimus davidi TaxID=227884 RepID=A0A914PYA3_9BILA
MSGDVVLLSDSDGEENYLKIYYEGTSEFVEAEIENNGNVLFDDVLAMDSRISALIIKQKGSKRIMKPKVGIFKEPKEKWKNVNVFAVLKKEPEIVSNPTVRGENPIAASNINQQIKAEPSTMLDVAKNRESEHSTPSTLPPTPVFHKKLETEPSTISTPLQNIGNLESPNSSDILPSIIDVSSQNFPTAFSSISIVVDVEEPTDDDFFKAYNVTSFKELRLMLSRGNHKYHMTCKFVLTSLRKTMVANPNKEIVRLIHFALTSDILLNDLDPKLKKRCKLCREPFTLQHLLSCDHIQNYHRKYNADPPEVAYLLDPKIYIKYMDPLILATLKTSEFKNMEDSAEFSIKRPSDEAIRLKYILIHRILQADLIMNYKSTFSVEKFVYLSQNLYHPDLPQMFTIKNYECNGCHRFPKNINKYLKHILSFQHIKYSLNQEEFDKFCKTMSFMEETSNGFQFLPIFETSRKRHHPSFEDFPQSNKRHKKF